MTQQDVYLYRSADSHSALPDWLATANYLSAEARILAWCILIRRRGPLSPTREELAEALGVDTRSIARWLDELRAANVLSTTRAGRRNLYVVHRPTNDHMISDRLISDRLISDRLISDRLISDQAIMYGPPTANNCSGQQEPVNSLNSENAISDRAGGGGDHHHGSDSPSAPPARRRQPARPCETRLGRYLASQGIIAAREFDRPELDADQWIGWFDEQLAAGMPRDRIVHLMRLGAPHEWRQPTIAPSSPLENEPAGRVAPELPTLDDANRRWNQLRGQP